MSVKQTKEPRVRLGERGQQLAMDSSGDIRGQTLEESIIKLEAQANDNGSREMSLKLDLILATARTNQVILVSQFASDSDEINQAVDKLMDAARAHNELVDKELDLDQPSISKIEQRLRDHKAHEDLNTNVISEEELAIQKQEEELEKAEDGIERD